MRSNSTAYANVTVRGPDVTYGTLKFQPQISSRANEIDVSSFVIRRGNDRFPLDELPLLRSIPDKALDDVLFFTFEADENELLEHYPIEFEIPDYDESVTIRLRAKENFDPSVSSGVIFQIEDMSGDWIELDNLFFLELMSESFIRLLETSVIENLNSHMIDHLPMDDES